MLPHLHSCPGGLKAGQRAVHRLELAMAQTQNLSYSVTTVSLKPPNFPIATPNQEDLKGLTLFFRVHEKLSELWLGIDKCLLSQATTQGAGGVFFIF